MIEVRRHGPVTEARCSTAWSRRAGFSVSLFQLRETIIDSGFPRVGDEVEAWVSERRPRGLVVTHAHEDHAGNIARLAARGWPVWFPPDRVAVPTSLPFYRWFIWGTPPAVGEVLPYDPAPLQPIATPGHSPDHHAVWDSETGSLFSGDLFLGVQVSVSQPGENPRLLLASLRRTVALAPARVFDSHRGPIEPEMLQAKLRWLEDTVGQIDRRIAEGWSDRLIRDRVLGAEPLVRYASQGEYAKLNFVRSLRCSGPHSSGPSSV